MSAITFEGRKIDPQSRDMLVAARSLTDVPMIITQGGYNKGGVVASAGTHDGGGALDIRAYNLTAAQRITVVRCLREVGFAAWLRRPNEGDWPYHIHAVVAVSDASAGAKRQVEAYRDHRNGLANNRADDQLPLYNGQSWAKWKAAHPVIVPAKPVTEREIIRIWSIQNGTKLVSPYTAAMNVTDTAYEDCAQFTQWAKSQGITTDYQIAGWRGAVERRDYDYAARILRDIVMHTQVKFDLQVDGVFGPKTAAVVAKFGYKVY